MAVISDISTLHNIHPPNKMDVGERLARWTLAKDYGRNDIVYSGPVAKSQTVQGRKAIIEFDHIGTGLKSRDGKKLTYFEVAASANGPFHQASDVKIEKGRVIVESNAVANPHSVRFAYSHVAQPNLVNSEGLPASVFKISK